MSDLERRIEALERANCRWRRAAGLLGGMLLIALIVAAGKPEGVPDLLQARRIEVLRPDGQPGVVLVADAHQSSIGLAARGENRTRVASLSADKEGARLMLMKHKEAPLFLANVTDAGATLSLFDGREPTQKPRSIVMRSAYSAKNQMGGATIALMRGVRKDDLTAGLVVEDATGDAALLLSGSQGKRATMRVNQGSGNVELLDNDNKPLWPEP
jgi:hypothetical protein